MSPHNPHQPAGTNLLSDALTDSRQQFRQMVSTLDRLVRADRIEEARSRISKLEALAKELHRLLHPEDPVDARAIAQIDRDLRRLQKATRKGWGGTVGKGVLALVLGGTLGIVALLGVLWVALA